MPDKFKVHQFEVTGGFDVDAALKPELSVNGEVIAFKRPDGSTVWPVLALEVEPADGSKNKYIISEQEMRELGFSFLEYENAHFIDTGVLIEEV